MPDFSGPDLWYERMSSSLSRLGQAMEENLYVVEQYFSIIYPEVKLSISS